MMPSRCLCACTGHLFMAFLAFLVASGVDLGGWVSRERDAHRFIGIRISMQRRGIG
jgi:hypothetical protein